MSIELTVDAFGYTGRRAFKEIIDFEQMDAELNLSGLKLPSYEQFPHPAIRIWEMIQRMRKEVTPIYTGNRFNSYDSTKNDQGYAITVAPDVPAV